jgi:hypothetical protein
MDKPTPKLRVYPSCCTSAFCGKSPCPPTCPNLPVLQDFKAWVAEHAAVCDDPIWCPLVYTATK